MEFLFGFFFHFVIDPRLALGWLERADVDKKGY